MSGQHPAFPLFDPQAPAADFPWTNGLTKRELIAGMALQGMLSQGIPGSHNHVNVLVPESVRYADALLAELAKDGQS